MNKLRGAFRIRTFGRRAYLATWLFGCMSLRVDFAAAQQPYTTWRDYLGGPVPRITPRPSRSTVRT